MATNTSMPMPMLTPDESEMSVWDHARAAALSKPTKRRLQDEAPSALGSAHRSSTSTSDGRPRRAITPAIRQRAYAEESLSAIEARELQAALLNSRAIQRWMDRPEVQEAPTYYPTPGHVSRALHPPPPPREEATC